MADEIKDGKAEKSQATDTPTIAIPIDGKEVNVPLSVLENVTLDLKEKDKVVKKTIKELREGGMRQDEFSRVMGEHKKKEDALAKEKTELNRLKSEMDADKATIKEMVDQLEGNKENKPAETGELNLSISEDEYYQDPMGTIKKLSSHSANLQKDNANLRKELDELKGNLNTFKTGLEDREKFVREMIPVVKKHTWLIPENSDFDPIKYEIFDARIKKLSKDATSEQFLELADNIHKVIGDREQGVISKYLESKSEKRKEATNFAPRGLTLPQDGLKINEKLSLQEAIEEAATKLSE